MRPISQETADLVTFTEEILKIFSAVHDISTFEKLLEKYNCFYTLRQFGS